MGLINRVGFLRRFRSKLIHNVYSFNSLPITKVFPGIGSVKIDLIGLEYKYLGDDGEIITSPNDMVAICAIIKHIGAKKIFELGTALGLSTLQFVKNSDDDAIIYTIEREAAQYSKTYRSYFLNEIDLTPEQIVGWYYKNTDFKNKIIQLRGDTLTYDFGLYYNKIDLVFIDACHGFRSVEKDSHTALKMLSEKGVIVWHDYNIAFPDVIKYLHRLSKKIRLYYITGTNIVVYKKNI